MNILDHHYKNQLILFNKWEFKNKTKKRMMKMYKQKNRKINKIKIIWENKMIINIKDKIMKFNKKMHNMSKIKMDNMMIISKINNNNMIIQANKSVNKISVYTVSNQTNKINNLIKINKCKMIHNLVILI